MKIDRYDLYYQANLDNMIYRKYKMEKQSCPASESIIEFELLCPFDSSYNDNYSFYQKI